MKSIPWVQTYSGRSFYFTRPDKQDIDIEDIAHALSMQCRYAGHCIFFYSVAEHCCHVCDYAQTPYKLAALLHDASEAYISDIPGPLKSLLPDYVEHEDTLMRVIADKYEFDWPLMKCVKDLDKAILSDERKQNMSSRADVSDEEWGAPLPALGVTLQFWSPSTARMQFLRRFHRWFHFPEMVGASNA